MTFVDISHPFVSRMLGALVSSLWLSVKPEHRQLLLDRHKLMLADALPNDQRLGFESSWDDFVAMQDKIQELGQLFADDPKWVDDMINSPRDAINAVARKVNEL